MTAGSPHPEQVRLGRNQFRQNFDTIIKQLPQDKKDHSRPKVKSILNEIFHENSHFGKSTAEKTISNHIHDDLKTNSIFSSAGGGFIVP